MIEFLKTEQLIYTPIYYYIDDNTKKKTPIGEKNNATIEEINALKEKKCLYFPPPTHKYKKKINDIWTDGHCGIFVRTYNADNIDFRVAFLTLSFK